MDKVLTMSAVLLPRRRRLVRSSGEGPRYKPNRKSCMTWEDIRTQYAGQWVLIRYHQLDEYLNVLEGEIVAHSPEKEELYRQLLQTTGQNIAIEYAGEFPQDLEVMLNT